MATGSASDRPGAPDDADRVLPRDAERPGDVLRRGAQRHVPGRAADLAAHGVEPGAEPADPLERDQVLGRAGPVELPVGQPADQRPAGELHDGGVDLRHADVVPAGQRAAPRQLPARLPVHERGRHPVGEHAAGRPLRWYRRIDFHTRPPLTAVATRLDYRSPRSRQSFALSGRFASRLSSVPESMAAAHGALADSASHMPVHASRLPATGPIAHK